MNRERAGAHGKRKGPATENMGSWAREGQGQGSGKETVESGVDIMALQEKTDEPGWCPLTGQRVFRSALKAWEIYGQYRFSVSQRNFLTYVGKGKACPPRSDGSLYVEDIEMIAQSRAWPPASSFVRGAPTGGEGGRSPEEMDLGAEYQ